MNLDELESEHARLLERTRELQREHERLEGRPHEADEHRAHRANLHAQVIKLHEHIRRLRSKHDEFGG